MARTGVLLVESARNEAEYAFLVLVATWRVVLMPAQSSEETVSKLVDRSRTGYSKRLDEVRATWRYVVPRLPLLFTRTRAS